MGEKQTAITEGDKKWIEATVKAQIEYPRSILKALRERLDEDAKLRRFSEKERQD